MDHADHATVLLHVGATHDAVQSIAVGEAGVVGALVQLHVEGAYPGVLGRML